MALIGDGFSHIAFGGVALGLFLNYIPFGIALLFSIVAALLIVKLREWTKIYGDVSIGIVFSFALALGVILISLAHGFSVDLHYFLFGNIVSITEEDVLLAVSLGLIVFVLLIFLLILKCLVDLEKGSRKSLYNSSHQCSKAPI